MEQVFSYIIGLGAAVMMPIIFTILGVCIGIKFSKALKSGLFVGVGFVGLSIITALLVDTMSPALSKVVEIYGLELQVFDMGWPAAASVAYNTLVGSFIIPVCLGVNLVLLLLGCTRTVNIDLWNYWHFAFIGAVVYFMTDSIAWGFFAAIICYIVTLVLADITAKKFQKFYPGMDGISIPQPFCQGFMPFAVAINIDPEILIVDEALSVGDVFFQAKCYRKFEDFKKQGKTILFVSHDLSSVSRYCDRVYLLNKGEMLGSGSPKEMIDKYKQILAGQAEEGKTEIVETGENDTLEYGNGKAKITDYYITDEKGKKTSAIVKGTEYTVHMKVKMMEDLPAPIFACSVKNVRGVEITGTNTLVSHTFDESAKKDEEYEITFRQRMMLQGGEYLISLGCTGYEGSDFKVYHRLYDIIGINVISDSDTVGFYDSDSEVVVSKK